MPTQKKGKKTAQKTPVKQGRNGGAKRQEVTVRAAQGRTKAGAKVSKGKAASPSQPPCWQQAQYIEAMPGNNAFTVRPCEVRFNSYVDVIDAQVKSGQHFGYLPYVFNKAQQVVTMAIAGEPWATNTDQVAFKTPDGAMAAWRTARDKEQRDGFNGLKFRFDSGDLPAFAINRFDGNSLTT